MLAPTPRPTAKVPPVVPFSAPREAAKGFLCKITGFFASTVAEEEVARGITDAVTWLVAELAFDSAASEAFGSSIVEGDSAAVTRDAVDSAPVEMVRDSRAADVFGSLVVERASDSIGNNEFDSVVTDSIDSNVVEGDSADVCRDVIG